MIPRFIAEIASYAVMFAFALTWPHDDDGDDQKRKRLGAAFRRVKTYLAWGVPAPKSNAACSKFDASLEHVCHMSDGDQ
jgi:hypothetical protein